MPINRDFVDPAELTNQTRVALAELEINSPQSLAPFLPSETIDDIEYEADAGQGGLIESAMYRSYDAELPIGRDEALAQMRGRIPSLGQKIPIFEEDRLRLRAGAEQGLTAAIERKAKRAARAVAIAVNVKRGEALATGKLQFVGNGQNFEVPFGRRADFTTAATDPWSDPDSDPVAYLEDLRDIYVDENGFEPGAILTSTAVKNAFYRHPKVNNAAAGRDQSQFGSLASPESVTALLGQYDLPGFTVRGGRVKLRNLDGSNTVKDLLPRDSIIMLPPAGNPGEAGSSELGATYWGQTIESGRPEWGIAEEEQSGIVAAVHDNDDVPARMWVSALAIAMPVLLNPNYSLVSKVI